MDDKKLILHANRWGVYMNEKEALIKSGYYVEVSGSDRKKVLWEMVDDRAVEEGKDYDKIGLRGFDFNLFGKDEKGVGG